MRTFLAGLAFFLLIGSTVAESPGYETRAHPTPIAELFAAAVKHGGYTKQCAARRGGCPIPLVLVAPLGENIDGTFYYMDPTVVRVSVDLLPGTLRFNETVVHEYVHYLQFLFGEYGPLTRCTEMGDIEAKAYKAGAAYLAALGVHVDYKGHIAWIAMEASSCEMTF